MVISLVHEQNLLAYTISVLVYATKISFIPTRPTTKADVVGRRNSFLRLILYIFLGSSGDKPLN